MPQAPPASIFILCPQCSAYQASGSRPHSKGLEVTLRGFPSPTGPAGEKTHPRSGCQRDACPAHAPSAGLLRTRLGCESAQRRLSPLSQGDVDSCPPCGALRPGTPSSALEAHTQDPAPPGSSPEYRLSGGPGLALSVYTTGVEAGHTLGTTAAPEFFWPNSRAIP